VTPEPGPLARALIGVARADHDDRPLAARICQAFVQFLDVHGAAISLLTATDARKTVWATDPTAAVLEDLQFTLGEGACVEAAVTGRPVLVPDLHDSALTARWPVFAGAVAEQTGARALFALPLQQGAINLGVLDLYRGTPGPLRGHDLRDALAAADTATLMLLGTPDLTGAPDTDSCSAVAELGHGRHANGDAGTSAHGDELWWDCLGSNRAEVHQATGMVLAQLGVPVQEAFVRLRAHAFATRRSLDEVARDVVARRLVFTDDMA
jgi:hypothetical protein